MADEYDRYLVIQDKGSTLRVFLSALTVMDLCKEFVTQNRKPEITTSAAAHAPEDFSLKELAFHDLHSLFPRPAMMDFPLVLLPLSYSIIL